MCGIVGIFVDKEKRELYLPNGGTFNHLIDCAIENSHRGEKDGVGLIDVTNNHTLKTILSLGEIKECETILENIKDNEKDGYLKTINKLINIKKVKTNFAFIHHRKKSVGEVSLNNCHPFKMGDGIFYIHNGTITDDTYLKNFISLKTKYKFNSDTDSELLAFVCEDYILNMEKGKEINSIKEYLDEIFGFYGVIIRFDTKLKTALIIKDEIRDLIYYEKDGVKLFVSEPIKGIDTFDKVISLVSGVFAISDENGFISPKENKIKDITKLVNDFYSNKMENYLCDCCRNKELKTARIEIDYGLGNYRKQWDFCVSCWINEYIPEIVKEELKKIEKEKKENKNNKRKDSVQISREYNGTDYIG